MRVMSQSTSIKSRARAHPMASAYAPALAFLMAIVATFPAYAFFDPPVVLPANPVQGQPISFDVRVGVCDFIQAAGTNVGMTLVADDMWREVTVSANTVRVVVRATFAPDVPLCIFPIGTFRFSIGTLSTGDYRLELYAQEIGNPQFRPLVGTANFRVGPPPASIPALGPGAVLTLMLLMIVVAAVGRRSVE